MNLNPCPKCGGTARLAQSQKFVYCQMCLYRGELGDDRREAIDKWNSFGGCRGSGSNVLTYGASAMNQTPPVNNKGGNSMKTVRLLSLTFRNFKRFKDFTFEPDGKNATVFGKNATGKTTIASGQSYLFFDKDIYGNSVGKNFEIKPLDKDNKPIPDVQVEVEGKYEIDGKVVTLKKVYAEKWVKVRGQTEREFKGHETTHYIDGVPVKKGEYDAFINSIASQEVLMLLTLPGFFNDDKRFSWQKRRALLVDVSGGISDEDIIASDAKLAKLSEILQGRDIDKHKAVVKARHSELNKVIEQIPARIDEVHRGLPDISDIDAEALPGDIAKLKELLQQKRDNLTLINSGGEIAQKKIELANIEAELQTIRNEFKRKIDERIGEKRTKLNELQMKIDYQLKRQIGELEKTVSANATMIKAGYQKREQLLAKFDEEKAKVLEFTQEATCPSCGYDLMAEMREKAEADFNQRKAEKLAEIQTEGKSLMAGVKELEKQNAELNEQITRLKNQLEEAQQAVAKLQAEINAVPQDINAYQPYIDKVSKKKMIESAIANLNEGNSEAIAKAKAEIAAVEDDIRTLEEAQAKVKQYDAGQKRIDELKAQEKTLSAEYTKLEGELFLIDLFNRTKASILEGKVNGKFKMARFKLFNQLVNGNLDECCETVYDGVPYGGGLNTGSRILVDMDIINVLSEHFGLSMPVFVDCAESVTEPIESNTQTIGLVAMVGENKLRVEIEENVNKEVA